MIIDHNLRKNKKEIKKIAGQKLEEDKMKIRRRRWEHIDNSEAPLNQLLLGPIMINPINLVIWMFL